MIFRKLTKPISFIAKYFFEWFGYSLGSALPVAFFVVITLFIPLTFGQEGTIIAVAILSGVFGFTTLLFRITSDRKEPYSMFGDEG